jgi:hypothetical protein
LRFSSRFSAAQSTNATQTAYRPISCITSAADDVLCHIIRDLIASAARAALAADAASATRPALAADAQGDDACV